MINNKVNIPGILVLSLMLSGCELIGPKLHEKIPLEPVTLVDKAETTEVIYQELSNKTAETDNEARTKIELYPGTGQFVAQTAKSMLVKSSEKGEYNLNFDDADLSEVVKVILSDILAENYLLSPKVTGKVTLQTSQALNKSELLPTLEMLLQINNAAFVYSDGLYQIKPKTEALSGSAFTTYTQYKQKIPAGYQIRVVPVRNVAVDELAEIIKPLMQDKSILHIDSNRNMMLIAGTPSELARAMEMVEAFDVDVMKGRSFGLFPLQNVDAVKMISELEQVFSKQTTDSAKAFFQFMEIERLNAILAITQQPKYLKEVERWVLRLDRANTSAGGGVTVYRVQHVDAIELAATLNDIFSQSGQSNRPASVAAGKKTLEVTNKKQKDTKSINTTKIKATSSIADVGDVRIIADEINNALIIVATAQDYAVMQQVIKQLDVMPLQVLIDATIVEVTLTDELKYGIKWFLSHNNGGENAISSNQGEFFTDALATAAGVASGGFGYAFISDSGDIGAVLDAAATDNKANVISSPSLMVLNNHQATIQVGKEVPILTSESTNTSGGADPVVTNTIQMRDTGITLIVKPRVNANGLVIMEIEQKADDVIEVSTSGINSPSFQQRQIQSTVAVQSGETIVLGGLINETDTFNQNGIPLLHKLPWIGPLFGETDKKNNKTELVVLITPRVIKTRQSARLITNEFKRKLSGIYQETVYLN